MAKRIIKLTSKQLTEAEEGTFSYLTNGDFKGYNGFSNITVGGNKDDETAADPKTTDDVARKISQQTYNRYSGPISRPHNIVREADTNADGVDDFYNNDELDTLGNGNDDDDLTKIPQGVQYKADVLMKALKELSPKQQGIVLNKVIEGLDLSTLPYSWLKELRLKINNRPGDIF